MPHLTLSTLRAQESATRASHSPLVKGSIFASPAGPYQPSAPSFLFRELKRPWRLSMPSKASEDCRGGAVRGGAAPPHGNNTFVPGFRNCCKRPTEAWTQSIAQPFGPLRREAAARRAGLGRGLSPAPQRRTPSRRVVCAAEQSNSGSDNWYTHLLLHPAVFRVRQPPTLSPEMRPVTLWPEGLLPNSRSESWARPAVRRPLR